MPGLIYRVVGGALLCIAAGASAQEPAGAPRTAAAILEQHRRALGPVEQIRTLGTESTLFAVGQSAPGVKTWWGPNGGWMREFASTKQGRRVDYVGGDAVYIYSGRSRAGYRPDDVRNRAWYYALHALATPHPMRAYFGNAKAQRGLKTAYAKGFDIIAAPPDQYGVRTLYLFERTTGFLSGIRFEVEENAPFATVQFERFEKVPLPGAKDQSAVLLPFGVRIELHLTDEAERTRRPRTRRLQMREEIKRWQVNPPDMPTTLSAPPPASGMAKGFKRASHRTGPSPQDLAVGDLDGDGRADIAVACVGGLWIHFGGAENRPVHVPLGSMRHRGCEIVDFDLDGRLDVLTMSWVEPSETLFLVSFDKQRKASKRNLYAAPGFGWGLAVDDFDRDGLPDFVATGNGSRNVSWSFGNGCGGIRAIGTAWYLLKGGRLPEQGFGVAVGDLNGDGIRDVAVAEAGRPRIVLFEGAPNVTFHPKMALDAKNAGLVRPVDVHFADVNGDGRDDLLVAQDHPLLNLEADIGVFMHTGKKLKIAAYLPAGERMQSVRTGDLDGDGKLDIIAASHGTDQVAWLRGNGDGTFKPARFLGVGRGPARAVVADLNGDGRPDVVASNAIDGSISICINSNGAAQSAAAAPATSVVDAYVPGKFTLRGLSEEYEFAGEFQLPDSIPHASGIAFLHGDSAHTGLMVVSDQRNALFRATVDHVRKRMLVSPAIPLRGAPKERYDLEGLAFDGVSGGTLFLAAESDNSILRTTIFGGVLGRTPTGVLLGSNDGIEGVALRRKRDGTPLLYLLKERLATTGMQPPVHVYDIEEEPFRLKQRGDPLRLPLATVDQTGAVATADQRLFIVSRLARSIAELEFEGDGFAKKFKVAGLRNLTEKLLGYPRLPSFGMIEGIARSHHGDLFLIIDNNGNEIGAAGKNRSRRSRVIWLKNRSPLKAAANASRVELRIIALPFKGAANAPNTKVTREQAQQLAKDCLRRMEQGASLDTLTKRYHRGDKSVPTSLTIVRAPEVAQPGELRSKDVPAAIYRLGFALGVGESGIVEYDKRESPHGYFVVRRIK